MYALSADSDLSSRIENDGFEGSPRNRFISSPPNLIDYPSLLRSPESFGMRTPSMSSPRTPHQERHYPNNVTRPLSRNQSLRNTHQSSFREFDSPQRIPPSIHSSPSLSSADSIMPRTPPPPHHLTLQQQQYIPRPNKEQLLFEEFEMLKAGGILEGDMSFEEWARENSRGSAPPSLTGGWRRRNIDRVARTEFA
jgi:hypothetical protein